MAEDKHVVIVGAGFAGLQAAKKLGNKKGIKVTVVDKNNHHLFQPLLYQVASSVLSPADIAIPTRSITTNYANISIIMSELKEINKEHKKILITSSISEEGKSFIAGNLAISLALTGKKVVLIEMDLRKPKLSPIFNKNNEVGISSYLIGKADISEIIQPTDLHENLSFISAGPIPPNPSELLLHSKVQDLFTNLETYYDYILIDTTPVGPVTDAEILSKYADATLYVIRQGYTPKTHLTKLKNNNKLNKLKNAAIIFNGLKDDLYYGYNYGYDRYEESHSGINHLMPKFMKNLKLS